MAEYNLSESRVIPKNSFLVVELLTAQISLNETINARYSDLKIDDFDFQYESLTNRTFCVKASVIRRRYFGSFRLEHNATNFTGNLTIQGVGYNTKMDYSYQKIYNIFIGTLKIKFHSYFKINKKSNLI